MSNRSERTQLAIGDTAIELDEEGYLLDFAAWNRDAAEALAQRESIALTDEHWEVLDLLRRFYVEYQQSPAMRALVKFVALHLGNEKGNSIHLLRLFPGSPAKRAARIAGLPRPEHCL